MIRRGVCLAAILVAGCPGSGQGPSSRRVAAPGDGEVQVGTAGGGEGTAAAPGPPAPPDPLVRSLREGLDDASELLGDAPGAPSDDVQSDDADPLGLETSAADRDEAVRQALERARSRLAAGDPQGAATAARAAFDLDGRSVEAIKILVLSYLARGWDLEARRMLSEVTGWNGVGEKSPELWFLLGRAHERTAEPDQAIAAYQQATRLKPSYARAWNNLGVALLRRGTVVRAVEALETAVSLDGDSAAIQTNLGTAYRRSAVSENRPTQKAALLRKAEKAYQTAIDGAVARGSSYPPAYFDLALLYLEAKTFPGLDDGARLAAATRNLEKFQQLGWTGDVGGDDIDVEAALQIAQRQQRALQSPGVKGKGKDRGGAKKQPAPVEK